jgi:hypothetical protein
MSAGLWVVKQYVVNKQKHYIFCVVDFSAGFQRLNSESIFGK